jgi:putative transposase
MCHQCTGISQLPLSPEWTMAPLCAEFGISRKTGYKIFRRYKGCGVEGLTDRSCRPQRHANQIPELIEKLIVRLKREYPTWGAPRRRS